MRRASACRIVALWMWVAHLSIRFVDGVIDLLAADANSISTLKQFQSCKTDDVDFTALGAARQGKKVFVRMAIKKMKEETKGAYAGGSAVGGARVVRACRSV